MNWNGNIATINGSELHSSCDRLPAVSRALSLIMYSQVVIEWNRCFCGNSDQLVHSSIFTRVTETEVFL